MSSEKLKVQVQRLNPEVMLPKRQTEGSSGYDVHAHIPQSGTTPSEIIIEARGGVALIPTGFKIAIPKGWEIQIRPRSGLALKHRISIPNSPGTIDSDYRGEVKVILMNLGQESFKVSHGMRIAQMVFQKVGEVDQWEVFDELGSTNRSSGGFGSTGV